MKEFCILTPTFSQHFKYIKKYLTSLEKFVSDKDTISIYFIISKNEQKAFSKIVNKYTNLNINILFFEDILEYFGINMSPEELLMKYGKFSFQSLKKFYGMLYLKQYRYFCVLDSESLWIKNTNMHQLVNDFLEKPFVIYSLPNNYQGHNIHAPYMDNINLILNDTCQLWFVEQFFRYWDVNILKDIINEYGSIFEMVEKIYKHDKQNNRNCGLFESVLYDQYVYNNLKKYNYSAICVDNILKKYLGDKFKKFIKNNTRYTLYGAGLSEHMLTHMTMDNVNELINLCKDYNFNVVRIDETNNQNFKAQIKFIKEVMPNMLVCSQNHCFGINNNLFHIIKINKQYLKLQKHINSFITPIKHFFKFVFEPFSILWYFLRLIIQMPKILYLYINSRRKND